MVGEDEEFLSEEAVFKQNRRQRHWIENGKEGWWKSMERRESDYLWF